MKSKYNMNLASEYYVLSMLYRKGVNAYLTLGNKKSIDIIIETLNGKLLTIDVKGLAGTTLWPLDNWKLVSPKHFLVLVSFLNKIEDEGVTPEVYILPSTKVKSLLYKNPKGTRQGINLSTMRGSGKRYKNAWSLLCK